MKPAKFFLLFLIILLVTSQNLYSQQCATMKDKFYLGAFQFSLYGPWFYDFGGPLHYPRYSQLSFNMMHTYGHYNFCDLI